MPANDSRGYCTNCVTRNFEPVKVIGRIVNNEKQKWCNLCKQVLLIEEIYPQIKGSNKRAKYCKKCNTTSSKIRVEALEYGVKYVFQTANNLCVKCFLELHNFDVDHILPRSKGGTDKVDNLQIMCRSCNRKKSDKESIDYRLPIDTDSSLVLKLIDQKNMLSRRNDGQTEESSG
jgi:5-methylcytosine-specific restriction endonuclease McrA